MDYYLLVTINSDKEHPPIRLRVGLEEYQALLIMATPVKTVTLGVERGIHKLDTAPLLDFGDKL